jgi:glucans biosynthesis protein C
MSSLSKQAALSDTGESATLSQTSSEARIFFLDHLRAALTVLVVLHHLAVIYGAAAVFYYVEPPTKQDQLATALLAIFVLVNQAFFMGFFFLISGYFTPRAYDRKGAATYFKDRLLRLGIPLLVYLIVLSPIAMLSPLILSDVYPAGVAHQATFPYLPHISSWREVLLLFGVGPLWFAEMLLFFCLGYVIWRLATRNRVQTDQGERIYNPPSYAVRIVVPIGLTVPIFEFPTFAYFPQYLSFFIVGCVAVRRNWFQSVRGSMGIVGIVIALVATIVLAPIALSNGAAFLGYGTLQSAAYALWDSIFSVGICLALLTFFRRFFNRQNRVGHFLSQQAFTVYIIHIPVIVLLALALRSVHIEALLKFALAALIGVLLCFALAFLIRRIPLAARIL